MPQGAPPILLDGALGTELAARGFELRAPLFSARSLLDAPELIAAIHRDYLDAGAQVLTTASFGLHVGTLAAAGLAERQPELVGVAVGTIWRLRQEARSKLRIAGSIPPRPRTDRLEQPDLARAEYRRLADLLADAGADLILLETFARIDEVRVALEGLAGIELPVWLAVVAGVPVPGARRPDGTRLLGGDGFEELAELLVAGGPELRVPEALLINCTQIDAVPAALDRLVATAPDEIALGLYPHLGKRRYDGVWVERIVGPDVYAEQIHAWMQTRPRLTLAGACCGSTPDYVAALRRALQPDEAAREAAFVRLAQLVP